MIKIKIGRRRFSGIYRWDEMTLRQFSNLATIPMPESYKAYILADGKFSVDNIDQYIQAVSKITDHQIKVEFPAYYRKVVSCLSNIPDKWIVKLTNDQIEQIYDLYLKPFVVTLLYHVPVIHFFGQITQYTPEQRQYFRIGLTRYYMPDTVNVGGQQYPLAKEPILTYSEASDIFRGINFTKDDIKQLSLFCAIYCRRKNETYNQENTLQRQELFMKMKMSDVWSVFFYTLTRVKSYNQSILLFGGQGMEGARDQVLRSTAAGV
jgi:hypothetical protein